MIARRTSLASLSLALLAAVLVAGCGSASPRKVTGLSVSPSNPKPSSELKFRFTAPDASGVHGPSVLSYSLSVTGPATRPTCIGEREASPEAAAKRGQTLTITLGPSQLHENWCAGAYTARVVELARAACRPDQQCPQFIRIVRTVGSASFTVAS